MTYGAPNRQIAEEAADWAVRLDAGALDESERRRLAGWLTASPVHVEELLHAASILGGLAHVDADRGLSIEALLAAHAPEVVPLFAESAPRTPETERATGMPAPPAPPSRARWMAIAAALLLMIAGGAFLGRSLWGPSAGNQAIAYETATGEQRSIALEDGSILHMNTSSSVRVALSATERRIDLLRGEALFEVAHDSARPFRVLAGNTVTQAVGTKFNVERDEDGVHVMVVEGKVLVRNRPNARFTAPAAPREKAGEPAADGHEVLVLAGYRADVEPRFAAPRVSPADIAEISLWRARQLSFENDTLAEIATEFNRYNRTQLIVADRRLAGARFSGAFSSHDPESFLAFLALTPGVQIDRSDPERIVLSLRGNGDAANR